MHRERRPSDRRRCTSAFALLALLTISTTAVAQGSAPRRQGGPGDGGAERAGGMGRPRIAANAQFPFVGSWVGRQVIAGRTVPIGVDIDVANGQYTGTTIWPNDARARHVNARVAGAELQWEQPNSGGGMWVYQAKRASADSVLGTVSLRGARGPDGPPPEGTFVLVRLPAASRDGRAPVDRRTPRDRR